MANLSAFGGAQPITPGGLVELGYGETDTYATITATSSASMHNLSPEVTVVCDGSPVIVEFYAPIARATQDAAGTGDQLNFVLQYDGSVQEDSWGRVANRSTAIGHLVPVSLQYRMTPTSGSHTFRVGAYVSNASRNGYVGAGTPYPPMFLRVSKIVQQNDGLKPFWTPPIVTQLPTNPTVGDTVIYSADATNGVYWNLYYDGQGSYPWKWVGGSPLYAEGTGSATSSAALIYTNSPSITLPLAGDYIFGINGFTQNSAAGLQSCIIRLTVAATTYPSADATSVQTTTYDGASVSNTYLLSGNSASDVATLGYAATASVAAAFSNLRLTATPVRVAA